MSGQTSNEFGAEANKTISIAGAFAESLSYASWQNEIPVLRALSVINQLPESFSDCELTLQATPPFLRSKTWVLDRIRPESETELGDRDLELDAEYLNGLNEAERGELHFTLTREGTVARRTYA